MQAQLLRYAYEMLEKEGLVVPLIIGFCIVPAPPNPLVLHMYAWWVGH